MQKVLSTEFQELKMKSEEAKALRQMEQNARWEQLENSLISSLNSKLEPIENAIKKETKMSNARHLATKKRQEKIIRMLMKIWEKLPENKSLLQKLKGE